jgi:hypothetical protein
MVRKSYFSATHHYYYYYYYYYYYAVDSGYNDTGLYDTSPIASDILWYQLIPHC